MTRMDQFENFTAEDFRKVLTQQSLKELQIIYLALGFGIFLFTIVLFVIYNTISEIVTSGDASQILLLSIIHFILLLSCFPLSKYLFETASPVAKTKSPPQAPKLFIHPL